MELAQQVQNLIAEVSCLICGGYLNAPVTTACGHNFCETCINRRWEQRAGNFSCPVCRATFETKILKPNRQLGNAAALVQQMNAKKRKLQDLNLCDEHQKELTLFCRDDEETICVVCSQSEDHTSHVICPIQEAASEYKNVLQIHLEQLERLEDHQRILPKNWPKAEEVEDRQTCIKNELKNVQEILAVEKKRLYSMLQSERAHVLKDVHGIRKMLTAHYSSLKILIRELQLKSEQPDLQILKDTAGLMSRCEDMKDMSPLVDQFPNIEETIKTLSQQYAILQRNMEEMTDTVQAELEWRKVRTYAVNVTLDPDTAIPNLIVSEDGTSVRARPRGQELPLIPEKLPNSPGALGQERFTSGRHYWEVVVANARDWSLGVCDESVPRKAFNRPAPERGGWVLSLVQGERYIAYTSISATRLNCSLQPRTVGVFLDYEAGTVSWYNVDERCHLFTFPPHAFKCTLRPYVHTCDTRSSLLIYPQSGTKMRETA